MFTCLLVLKKTRKLERLLSDLFDFVVIIFFRREWFSSSSSSSANITQLVFAEIEAAR